MQIFVRAFLVSRVPVASSFAAILTVLVSLMVSGLLSSCSPRTSFTSKSSSAAHDEAPSGSFETRLLLEVNLQRRESRKEPLVREARLDDAARQHSEEMARRGSLGHDGFDDRSRRLRQDLPLSMVGENVAKNQGFADPVGAALQGWLKSQAHRKNLLGDFDLTGIGIAEANDGTLYFTQIFGRSARLE